MQIRNNIKQVIIQFLNHRKAGLKNLPNIINHQNNIENDEMANIVLKKILTIINILVIDLDSLLKCLGPYMNKSKICKIKLLITRLEKKSLETWDHQMPFRLYYNQKEKIQEIKSQIKKNKEKDNEFMISANAQINSIDSNAEINSIDSNNKVSISPELKEKFFILKFITIYEKKFLEIYATRNKIIKNILDENEINIAVLLTLKNKIMNFKSSDINIDCVTLDVKYLNVQGEEEILSISIEELNEIISFLRNPKYSDEDLTISHKQCKLLYNNSINIILKEINKIYEALCNQAPQYLNITEEDFKPYAHHKVEDFVEGQMDLLIFGDLNNIS